MKRFLLTIAMLPALAASAQLNNSWIDYSKTYYKFKVASDQLHRIPQSSLAGAGLGSVNADLFQVWHNGQQVRLHTSANGAPLPANGYLEFWGEMNDGKADLPLYHQANFQLADRYSLETDTSVYFLTTNSVVSANLRYFSPVQGAPGAMVPEPYFMRQLDVYYKDRMNRGYAKDYGQYVFSAAYENGEGWTSGEITSAFTQTISGINVAPGAPANSVSFRIRTFSNTDFNSRTTAASIGSTQVIAPSTTYNTSEFIGTANNLPNTILSPSTNVTVNVASLNPAITDRNVIAMMGITYPSTFNFNGATSFAFELPATATGNYLVINNFNSGSAAPVLYDVDAGRRWEGDIVSTPGQVKFVLPASSIPLRRFILNSGDPSKIMTVPSLTAKNFLNITQSANRGDYIIISDARLFNDGSGNNNVEQYRQYRSSVAGGAYNAKVYEMSELTDQFGFGIKQHPASIRDFVRYMDQNFSPKPKYVLLLGRGMTYTDYRANESNPMADQLSLVPTFGYPASDVLLVSAPGTQVPITPVGRIAAVNGSELGNYLQKVKDYELIQRTPSPSITDKGWMKDGFHIVGGQNPFENSIFEGYMNSYKGMYEDTLYGGKIETFLKTSNATVQQVNSDRINQLLTAGTGYIGYFGHSSASVLEFNLGSPEVYSNPIGRYPFFNVSGCSVGNFFYWDPQRLSGIMSLSEKYTMIPNKGSIGLLADSHFGIPGNLNAYNHRFVDNFTYNMYGQSVGNQIKELSNYLGGNNPGIDWSQRIHLEEITLAGDPAVKINSFAKPDYAIEDASIKVTPAVISVADASFHVRVDMRNLGKAIHDSIRVYIKRQLPNSTAQITLKDTIIRGIRYRDSIDINVPINPATDAGQNSICVSVDYLNHNDELYETNNLICKPVFVFEDNLRPVYPYNYSIVNTQNITYSASTANPLLNMRTMVMELDTTEQFNSPFKKTYSQQSIGGVIQFTPTNVTFTDSTVYYWRTSVTPLSGATVWSGHSFVYYPGNTPGYNQSHFYQHQKSTTTDLSLDPARNWKFTNYLSTVTLRNGVFPTAASFSSDFMVDIDGSDLIKSTCGVSALIFNVINPAGMNPLRNAPTGTPGQFGSDVPCGPTREYNFQYSILTQASRNLARDFLVNHVPAGWYVTARMTSGTAVGGNTYAAEWAADGPNSLYQVLKASGFTDIDSFNKPRAFNYIYKKGDNSFTPVSQFSVDIYDKINTPAICPAIKPKGVLESPAFGPGLAWNRFQWRGRTTESPSRDSVRYEVIGINNSGAETVLFSIDSTNHDLDISSVNAAQYRYLKMRMYTADSTAGTPYQLRYWRLIYTPVPEGAIAPNIRYTMKDTVDAGEPIDFSVAFKNISPSAFAQLMKVNMRIRTASNVDSIINIAPMRILQQSPDTLVVTYRIASERYQGANTLIAEFNPNDDQPEQTHFNNVLVKNFFVRSDLFSPLLDVTFDGVHILSRDIVSAKPAIQIKLKDENKFLALKDTALMKVQLRYPDQTLHNYYFNNDTMRFTPATAGSGDNSAMIDLRPHLLEDGEYELIVSGKDASGNDAGNFNYRTVFTVINKPMISEMLNYPNPFTTSTAFVFTLTGSRVPSNIRIQILTITGKIVREINKNELGNIHVGRNITEYKWDGTDQYGQKLGNGVYLYRVITNLEGNSLDKYKAEGDNTDQYFKKGYGKMYLMR